MDLSLGASYSLFMGEALRPGVVALKALDRYTLSWLDAEVAPPDPRHVSQGGAGWEGGHAC